jgi:hypothetical protein
VSIGPSVLGGLKDALGYAFDVVTPIVRVLVGEKIERRMYLRPARISGSLPVLRNAWEDLDEMPPHIDVTDFDLLDLIRLVESLPATPGRGDTKTRR